MASTNMVLYIGLILLAVIKPGCGGADVVLYPPLQVSLDVDS